MKKMKYWVKICAWEISCTWLFSKVCLFGQFLYLPVVAHFSYNFSIAVCVSVGLPLIHWKIREKNPQILDILHPIIIHVNISKRRKNKLIWYYLKSISPSPSTSIISMSRFKERRFMGIFTCWNEKQSKCKCTIPNLYEHYLLNSKVVFNVTINRK